MSRISESLHSKSYDFLKTDPRLSDNIILLGLGGSYGYGTNTPDSDIDVRGCAVNTPKEILCEDGWNDIQDRETDTVIYSLKRLTELLEKNNPNTLELLGLKDYLYLSPIGQKLLDNKNLFCSQEAFYTFGGYAKAQLKRLENKAVRDEDKKTQEYHILNELQQVEHSFFYQYRTFPEDAIHLYIDRSQNPELEKEIYMDINLTHYPLRDYKCMWSDMNNIVKDYGRLGQRNKHAIEHGKLGKHMMHLIRLYLTGIELLRDGVMHTYRENDLEFLNDIRHGKYLDENDNPTAEFFDIVDDLENKMEDAKNHSPLPKKPDHEKIRSLLADLHLQIITEKGLKS